MISATPSSFAGTSVYVLLHNRNSTPHAKRERRDAQTGRGLLSLVLVQIHLADDVVDGRFVESALHQIAAGQTFLDISFQNRIEHIVGRQTVLVDLPRSQFSGRRFLDRVDRNDFTLAIDPT